MRGLEHLGEEAGDDDGGDGNGGEAADDHAGVHLAHEVIELFLGLAQSLAGVLGDDGVGGEAVESGQAVGQSQRVVDLQKLGSDELEDGHTGNADDDGYLSAAAYQQQINSQVYVPSYIDYYLMRVQNPYNYSRPIRASLGIQFGF